MTHNYYVYSTGPCGLEYWNDYWTTGTTFNLNFNMPYSAKFPRRIIFADMPDAMARTSKIKLREMLEHCIISNIASASLHKSNFSYL